MTVETHIVAREGKMVNGEHVTTKATAVAVDSDTGLVGEGVDETEEKAIATAKTNLLWRLEWLSEHNEYLAYVEAGGILLKDAWRENRG